MAILRNTLDVGLVLAPELVVWKHRHDAPTVILQRRMCFTELGAAEMPNHAKTFGPFALKFSPDKLRAAGAMPVIYAPQELPGHPASVIAEFCVRAAAHTKGVLESLNHLQRVANAMASGTYGGLPVAQDASIDLNNVTPGGALVNQFKIKPADLAALMTHIGYRNIPFDHSIAMLGIYENMFYPTDNSHSDDLLGYYRQREWRLVTSDIAIEGQKIVRELTEDERHKVEAVDAGFWRRELTFKGRTASRLEFAQVYQIHGGLSPRDLIEGVVVPESAEAAVRDFYDGELEVVKWDGDEHFGAER
ncbi:abortive infection system antitoxin AbiGi family protein [Pandoraea apista]|uniref:abortive infection system antitoxin AbiGi family protein n=1 Tax=Pandoraea apista TaxID=93218 RepID=UPI0015E715B6|nr:abortive infection system antitoxin AbiGi family protein [Pandoraea apista]